jgi:hypothetical protein
LAISPLLEFATHPLQTLASAGVAQKISASEIAVEAILIFADSLNTGTIYVGGTGVTSSNGIPLTAGQELPIYTDRSHGATADIDMSTVYINGDNTGDKVRIIYMKRQS